MIKKTLRRGVATYRLSFLPNVFLSVRNGPDPAPDCHDHPWDFAVWPLTSYVEHVWDNGARTVNVVSAGRWHGRDARYCHRVLEPLWAPFGSGARNGWNATLRREQLPWYTRLSWRLFGPGRVVCIVKHGAARRKPGLRKRTGKTFVWIPREAYEAGTRNWLDDKDLG